jgi:HrpA-like RNA helicase
MRAVRSLVALGALTLSEGTAARTEPVAEALTPLGRKLASLPVDPRLGKTLLCAHALGCLSPVALVVAWLTAPRDPLGRGAGRGRTDDGGGGAEEATPAAVKRFLDRHSDHAAFVRAHAEWSSSLQKANRVTADVAVCPSHEAQQLLRTTVYAPAMQVCLCVYVCIYACVYCVHWLVMSVCMSVCMSECMRVYECVYACV